MAKKKQGMSPTFKAGFIIILVLFIIWGGVMSTQDAWYETPKVEEDTQEKVVEPIDVAKEEVIVEDITDESKESNQEDEEIANQEEDEEEVPPPLVDTFDYNQDVNNFSTDKHGWSFKRNAEHTPVVGYTEACQLRIMIHFTVLTRKIRLFI